VVEIDGASNRGIDEIRELKSQVALAPFSAPYKVYIVDEVHMLTEHAFNALLKTLEEPPASVVFILATTSAHKVPVTIRSRCQHLPFHRIALSDMAARLRFVVDEEGFQAEEGALFELARQADGALRDALSLLEQALAAGSGRVDAAAVRSLLGGASRVDLIDWLGLLGEAPDRAVRGLDELVTRGASLERILDGLALIFRDLWVLRRFGSAMAESLGLPPDEAERLGAQAAPWRAEALRGGMEACLSLVPRVRAGLRGDVFAGLVAGRLLLLREGGEGISGAPLRPSREAIPSGEPPREERALPPSPPVAPSRRFARGPSLPPEVPFEDPAPAPDSSPAGMAAPAGSLGIHPVVAAAFLSCRVREEGEELRIVHPEGDEFARALCSSPRARLLIRRTLVSLFPESGIRPDGDGAVPEFPPEAGEGTESPRFRVPESVRARRGTAFDGGPPPAAGVPDASASAVGDGGEEIRDLLAWMDAEVLFVRGGEPSDDAPPEEGSE
jgi:DNA polymerase-3 subunit gamma/tau